MEWGGQPHPVSHRRLCVLMGLMFPDTPGLHLAPAGGVSFFNATHMNWVPFVSQVQQGKEKAGGLPIRRSWLVNKQHQRTLMGCLVCIRHCGGA